MVYLHYLLLRGKALLQQVVVFASAAEEKDIRRHNDIRPKKDFKRYF